MLIITSHKIKKSEISVSLTPDPTEEKIFTFIRKAIGTIPKPVVARAVGGWVRDKLLGAASKDLDITIEGMTGIDFANVLKKFAVEEYGPNQDIVGTIKDTEARPEQIKNLAVAFLRIYGEDVEILNVRGSEVYEQGSRNPIKLDMNASPIDDAFRRDLTINSLFYNINTKKIEDFTGKGYDDLLTMTLRTPLDPIKTFKDDPLRLLRVLRFYSRYPNSKISPEVIEAMKDEEVQNQITRKIKKHDEAYGVVPERTAEELRKMMIGSKPEAAIQIMYSTGLLAKMLNLPDSFNPLDMDQKSNFHQLSVIEHTIEVIKNVNNLSKEFQLSNEERLYLNLSALFHDIGKLDPRSQKKKNDGTIGYSGNEQSDSVAHEDSSAEIWDKFSSSLKLSDKEKETIKSVVSGHMVPHSHFNDQTSVNPSALRRYMRKNPLWKLQYIHAMADAVSKSKNEDRKSIEPYKTNYQLMSSDEFSQPPGFTPSLINGNRIIELVGKNPKSGYVETVKERIRSLQDNNPSLTVEEAEQEILSMISRGEV